MTIPSIKYYLSSFWVNFSLKAILASIVWFLPLATKFFFGSYTPWLEALLIIYCIDVLLWVWIAISRGNFKIERFMKGIYKFILFWVAISVWNQIDKVISDIINTFDYANVHLFLAKFWIIGYMAIHEWISTLWKLHSIWIPIPKWLMDKLLGYKSDLNKEFFDKIKEKSDSEEVKQ